MLPEAVAVLCDVCDDEPRPVATHRCPECEGEALCGDCVERHGRAWKTSGHVLLELEEHATKRKKQRGADSVGHIAEVIDVDDEL